MLLSALTGEFIANRGAVGLFLAQTEVLACAVRAVRYYMGWQDLADLSATGLAAVAGSTDITASEWVLIAPLFLLYVERESAIVVEASRGMGVEPVGRASSEVAAEIQQAELGFGQMAYIEPVFAVGYPAVI